MEFLVVWTAALLGAGLSLFSGFGLGTLLLAVFVIFFPPGVAVAVTAVVHFLNNVFKFGLLGRHTEPRVVVRFGLPAIGGAWLGALALGQIAGLPALWAYPLGERIHLVTPVKLAIGLLLLCFAWLELWPRGQRAAMPARYLPLGGLLSGFFGGLSGHQGALRSMFLLRAGLSTEAYVATGVAIALLIDITRLSTYLLTWQSFGWAENVPLVAGATCAAFAGSFLGTRLLHKTTIGTVQRIVGVLLAPIGLGLASGLL